MKAAHSNLILDAALVYCDAGLSVLPTHLDKTPAIPTWADRQDAIPTQETIKRDFSGNGNCVAIICGKVSGNTETIDFDQQGLHFRPWCQIVEKDAPGLLDRLVKQKTQNGGYHITYRCPEITIPGNKKLAIDKHQKVTIETRGERAYFLAHPSPRYKILQGKYSQLPIISTAERDILLSAARSLNQHIPKPTHHPTIRDKKPGELAPGDDYNQHCDIEALLTKHGWVNTGRRNGDANGTHWRRPGKDRGQSATLFDNGVFYNFSTNAMPLAMDQSYTPFGLYTMLEHGGDFTAAARDLGRQGYGSLPEIVEKQGQKSSDTAQKTPVFECITLDSIHAEKLEEKPIIEGLLYEDEQALIYGDGGTGKSLVTEDLSMALGSNFNILWDMFEIPQYRASMFIQSENGRLAVHQRTVLKCQGNPAYLVGLGNVIYASQFGNIQVAGHVSDKEFRTQIIDFAKFVEDRIQLKIGVIFFDPLISFHDAEENDNSRMRTTLDHILMIANQIKATPVVVHHSNKENGLRGATAIQNWARNIIKLQDASYRGEKRIKFAHEKCNNHKMFEPFMLAMDDHLNFSPMEIVDSLQSREKDRCSKVKEALELLGGKAEKKAELVEQYKELSGIKNNATCHRHINNAVNNNFVDMEYYKPSQKKRNSIIAQPN